MNRLTIQTKGDNVIPKGATIIKKEVNTRIEEIENGFLVIREYEIRYKIKDSIDYAYITKKVFTEENPIEIKDEKMLADNFD